MKSTTVPPRTGTRHSSRPVLSWVISRTRTDTDSQPAAATTATAAAQSLTRLEPFDAALLEVPDRAGMERQRRAACCADGRDVCGFLVDQRQFGPLLKEELRDLIRQFQIGRAHV